MSYVDLPYSGSFSLSVTRAMRDQLIEALGMLGRSPLSEIALSSVQPRGGIYQLFLDGDSVYIGKSKKQLRSRLAEHLQKISGRQHDLQDRVTFKCLYVDEDMDALAPEKMMIATFLALGKAKWNNNGFGNNDPGRERDTSAVKSTHFDRLFPIDLGKSYRIDGPGLSLLEAMRLLKRKLPYTFRYGSPTPNRLSNLGDIEFILDSDQPLPVAEWMSRFAMTMPEGWHITALPGYIISYPEIDPSKYSSRVESWVAKDGNEVCHEVRQYL